MTSVDEFADRYGPWAVIAGASEGVGAEFARVMGERGVNVVLDRPPAAEAGGGGGVDSGQTGAETRVAAVDLSRAEAIEKIVEVTSDLEVGMLMYVAGADPELRAVPRPAGRERTDDDRAQLHHADADVPSLRCADGGARQGWRHRGVLGSRTCGLPERRRLLRLQGVRHHDG